MILLEVLEEHDETPFLEQGHHPHNLEVLVDLKICFHEDDLVEDDRVKMWSLILGICLEICEDSDNLEVLLSMILVERLHQNLRL